ncbi:hypothetical protein AXG93_4697s1110 [Marchantia polymorpha subsp. ruderalis]|uniref:Uncharacterized protein n=1 Tax=Marchantia polymorpha subsp. ruderalis TaxID=1480154 RepID=A0A176VR56_MARPO|nr:hypothetical protein AXG93_4697s1110 [Marchantia polymorpha subsp. ruderalis]
MVKARGLGLGLGVGLGLGLGVGLALYRAPDTPPVVRKLADAETESRIRYGSGFGRPLSTTTLAQGCLTRSPPPAPSTSLQNDLVLEAAFKFNGMLRVDKGA